MRRCTCYIVQAPTYEVYVQELCGIHRNMIEETVERCAQIAESAAIHGHNVQWLSCIEIARKIRESLNPKSETKP